MELKKPIAIYLIAATLVFSVGLPAYAAVPTFDVGLNPKFDRFQNEQFPLLLSMIAGIYQKEVGQPPYPPPVATAPTLSQLISTLYRIEECPVAAAGGIIGAILGLISGTVSLDCITWTIGKTMLNEFTQNVVSWIQGDNVSERFFNFASNTFFTGNPLAVTDWEGFLLAAADTASGYFINELGLTQLCEPFATPIRQQASSFIFQKGQPLRERARCTVTESIGNLETFYRNFAEGGGWAMWRMASQIPSNNPYIVESIARENRTARVSSSISKNFFETIASEGLLGVQKCEPTIETDGGLDVPIGENCRLITPGQSVKEILRDNIGAEVDQLVEADELDELLYNVFQALIGSLLFSNEGLLNTNVNNYNVVPASGSGIGGADSDGDGVPNSSDACPGTPAGTPVATNGCPIPLLGSSWLSGGNTNQPTSISQSGNTLTFTNENGQTSSGYFQNATVVVATDWGITGTLNSALNRIDWSNGTFWTLDTSANRSPVANAGLDQTAAVGSPVAFDGSGSSDPDGNILGFAWNFGDGSGIVTGVSQSHTYSAEGVYTVTLTVSDGFLSDTDTLTVTVSSAGSPPPPA